MLDFNVKPNYDTELSVSGMTIEQTFARVFIKLRSSMPFYSAIYQNMERIEEESCDTMGVTYKQIIYGPKFVLNTPIDDFMFVNLHEIGHVALLHVVRAEGRDPKLWNYACDMIVNKALSSELKINPGQTVDVNGCKVRMPTNLVFVPDLDEETESVESLYEKLNEQAKQNGYNNYKFSGGQDQNQQGQQGQQGQGQQGQGQPGQGQGQGQGQGKSGQQGQQGQGQGQGQPGQGQQDQGQGGKFKFKINNTEFEIKADAVGDIRQSSDNKSLQEQHSRRMINEAITKSKLWGCEAGNMQRQAAKSLVQEVKWEEILRKYLIASTSTDTSFAVPDKRMYYQSAIYPGAKSVNNVIDYFAFCIDTSGSIGDRELGEVYAHVEALTKKYKFKAKVIYWDTEVASVEDEIKDFAAFKKTKIKGGGGTDPSCVFEYINSKKCTTKPSFLLFFTDGYFDTSSLKKYAVKHKNTIWLTIGRPEPFKPPFGVAAKYNKKSR